MNVILPLVYYMLGIGRTIDLKKYDMGSHIKSIFNETDVLETRVNALNSTYYVLEQDDNRLFSALGAPIDLVLGIRANKHHVSFLHGSEFFKPGNLESVSILVVTEYRTIDRSLKENATPITGWQKFHPKSHTHYIDKMIYGGKCVSLITIQPEVAGDLQVLRRILTDVMGTSGHIGKDTVGLWNKAMKAVKGSEDVRGEVYIVHSVSTRNAYLPPDAYMDLETMLKHLSDFPKYVIPPNPERNQIPLYSRFRPLHDLDEWNISLEKNVLGERYMMKLNSLANDLEYTYKKLMKLMNTVPEENEEELDEFGDQVSNLWRIFRRLVFTNLSLYRDIDLPAFNSAFDKYQEGLKNSADSYLAAYHKVRDDIGVSCDRTFLRPTRGFLKVRSDEVIQTDRLDGGLPECQDVCVNDKKCRAVGFNRINNQCFIYYRSTNSATISFPSDFQVYDRKCK